MVEDLMRYDKMIELALRNVVRTALEEVAQKGLPGEHHFYISFATAHPEVEIPDYLRKQYPEEMTIVLQYQFFNLTITPEEFSVVLSFNNVREKLIVPFEAITTFADPSVNFALQFQSLDGGESGEADQNEEEEAPPDSDGSGKKPAKDKSKDKDKNKDKDKDGEKRGEVVSLDMFRKK